MARPKSQHALVLSSSRGAIGMTMQDFFQELLPSNVMMMMMATTFGRTRI
jgi:hypothetical protein